MRPSGRKNNEVRKLQIIPHINTNAEGSCMVSLGGTKILCTATLEEKIPKWLKGKGKGWITAEYAMLPRATKERTDREAKKGQQTSRTQEIQRLISRSLRATIDLNKINGKQFIIDCDVLHADGGTRTLSITGGYIALALAIKKLTKERVLVQSPLIAEVAGISCGIYKGMPILDLDYEEDSEAESDSNFIFNSKGEIIEIQGTAETKPFSVETLLILTKMAQDAVQKIIEEQRKVLAL